ncbi:MAG: hypothetical protein ACX94B_01465 [Henriciella sp.]
MNFIAKIPDRDLLGIGLDEAPLVEFSDPFQNTSNNRWSVRVAISGSAGSFDSEIHGATALQAALLATQFAARVLDPDVSTKSNN